MNSKTSLKDFLFYWVPCILFMGLIFYLSSRPSTRVSDEFTINFIFFKSLHMIEYAILYFLLFRALRKTYKKMPLSRVFFTATIIAILYASSDELHQTFVPTREGKLRDVFIDTAGITIMYIYIRKRLSTIPKYFL